MPSPLLAITLDVEWAPAVIIEEMVSWLTQAGVPATLFCTDEPSFNATPLHETGLHPNFCSMDDWMPLLDALQAMYPHARGLRSHCLHSDTRLARLLPGKGIAYQSNLFVPGQPVLPFRLDSGLWEIPIHYMDDYHIRAPDRHPCGFTARSIPRDQPVVVVDFHPIPWFINAATLSDYETAKAHYKDPVALRKLRRSGPGVRDLFSDLIKEAAAGSWQPVTMIQLLSQQQLEP